jgi:hypothetical protein
VRDLVDIIVIARTQQVHGSVLRGAIEGERGLRGLAARTTSAPPPSWAGMYAKVATSVHCPREYVDAVQLAVGFVEPALQSDADGMTWSPDDGAWSRLAS